MVNYLYRLADIEGHHEAYVAEGRIAAASAVKALAQAIGGALCDRKKPLFNRAAGRMNAGTERRGHAWRNGRTTDRSAPNGSVARRPAATSGCSQGERRDKGRRPARTTAKARKRRRLPRP